METLMTRWASEAKCDCPLPEYPRPQMVREGWQCLNGMYDYAITAAGAESFPQQADGLIRVPFAVESCLSGVCGRLTEAQLLWYRRRFKINGYNAGKRTLLHFGAVDWECSVYVNGELAGKHRGGYCPFTLDITDLVNGGENELIVSVFDPTDKGWQSRGKQASKSHGFWYTSTSGIWQTVWLEQVSKSYIASCKLTPDIDKGIIKVETRVMGDRSAPLRIKILDGERLVCERGISATELIEIPGAKPWSPEEPFLYDYVLELMSGGAVCDRVLGYFGMRKFGIDADSEGILRLTLNNKPYFQRGLLDQGYWADGGMTPPTDEAMVYDIQTMKRLGFNMLRKHIKVEPDRWYYHCDKIGMIVWQDMISGGSKPLDVFHAGVKPTVQGVLAPVKSFSMNDGEKQYGIFGRESSESREDFEKELYDMVDTLYSHPCIGCWVPFNEGWGQFDAKRIALGLKLHDPTRLVDHASGWYDQKCGDLRSVHKYILPVVMPKYDGRPFVLSEYGGYSNVLDGHVWNKSKSFGYQMYKSKESLTNAYRKLHEKQIIPKIKKGLCATVYTQVSDVEFEVNGMLTYDREIVKLDEQTVIDINKKMVY